MEEMEEKKGIEEDRPLSSHSQEERQSRVLLPSTTSPVSPEVDKKFYNVTKEDISYMMELEQKKKEESSVFRTREMRERDKQKKTRQYSKVFIRFRFPNRIELQGTFSPQETTNDLFEFVKKHLSDDVAALTFTLFTTPPPSHLKPNNMSLLKQGLVPSAVVMVGFKDVAASNSGFLKPEVLALAQSQNMTSNVEPKNNETVDSKSSESQKETQISKSKGLPKWFSLGKKK